MAEESIKVSLREVGGISVKIVLFGAGKGLKRMLERHLLDGYDVVAICDNDTEKCGRDFILDGVPIICPSELDHYDYEKILVTVLLWNHRFSILDQLKKLGIYGDKIIIFSGDEIVPHPVIQDAIKCKRESRTYMDTTCISLRDWETGIPRTVNQIYRYMKNIGGDITPIRWWGKSITGNTYDSRINGEAFNGVENIVEFKEGDKIFFPDASWESGTDLLIDAKNKKAKIYAVIYDLIPLQLNRESHSISRFKTWIDTILMYADAVACISKSVAKDVSEYYLRERIDRSITLPIYCFHLGYDLADKEFFARSTIRDFVKRRKTFLMVGGFDIKKNHLLAVKAFKKINSIHRDLHAQLLIIGRNIGNTKDFEECQKIMHEMRDFIMWIQDAPDEELQWAYQNCAALLFPSKAEGFGLPLVEAAHFRLPIVCSDIPVFREIAGENADYFKSDDADSLCDVIVHWLQSDKHPDSGCIKLYSWKECAKEVLDILEDKAKPYTILDGNEQQLHI